MTTLGRPRSPDAAQSTSPGVHARQLLTGVLISGIFGLSWGQWAASGLTHGASIAVRIASTVIGVTIVGRAARLRRAAAPSGAQMFGSSAYRFVVLAEFVALVAAVLVLVTTGNARFLPVAVAAIAGVHFAAFGYLFDRLFGVIATGLIVAAAVGLVIGLRDGSTHAIEATTGLIAAATLFAGAVTRLAVAARSDTPAVSAG